MVYKYGKVWVAHGYKGIFKLQLASDFRSVSQVTLYDRDKGLPSNLYNGLLAQEDELLVGTQNGVYQYNRSTDQMEPSRLFGEILGAETLIRKLYKSPGGQFLAIKNYDRTDEIALIDILDDGSYQLQETPFQKLRGQLIPAFEAVDFPDNNFVFLGGKHGLIIYNSSFSR